MEGLYALENVELSLGVQLKVGEGDALRHPTAKLLSQFLRYPCLPEYLQGPNARAVGPKLRRLRPR